MTGSGAWSSRKAGALILFACLVAAVVQPCAAQQMALSMKRAVEIATEPEGSVRMELAAEAIKLAQSRKGQARAALLPHIDGMLYWESRVINLEAFGIKFGIPGTSLVTPTRVGPFEVVDARARGSQTIFSLSAIRNYQASKAGVRAARQENEETRDKVASQVAKAYLGALRAEARLETAQSNVALAESLLALAESQKAAGTGTGIDVTRARVQLQNERQHVLVAANDRRRAHLELLRAMDLRLEVSLDLIDRLTYHPLESVSPEAALTTALESRADWSAQQRREETARLGLSAVKWERLPSATFYGDYGTIGATVDATVPTRAFGFRVNVPVFDGGRMDARRAESGSGLRLEMIRTADLRSRIELEIRLALDTLNSTSQQVEVAIEGVGLAEQELAQAQRRFKAGVTNSVEVTDAQNRIARALDNRIAAVFGYESARLDYGTSIGKIREYIQ